MQAIIDQVVTTPDPTPQGVPNPIHDGDGAAAAGYAGALVAGVRTYGWVVQTIVRALGAQWLANGWVDFTLRRPLFAGEVVTIELKQHPDEWRLACTAGESGSTRVVMDGTAGLGEALWVGDLNPPDAASAQSPPDIKPSYELASVPSNTPLTPLGAYVSASGALAMVRDDLGVQPGDAALYETERRIHPYFLAGRMAPLTRHNFTYGPTIHVRSQIQHNRTPLADREFVVGAQIVDAYERNEHWYQVLDGVVTDDLGQVCRIRHHTIFRPRGT